MFYFILIILFLTFIFDLSLSILNYRYRNTKIPEVVNDVYDFTTYQKWLNYTMENYRINFISKTIHFILTFCILIFGFFPFVYSIIKNIFNNLYSQTITFLAIYFLLEYIISIPFLYYQKFNIEEKYGFNKSTKKTFLYDQIKGIFLISFLGGGFIIILTYLYDKVGNLFYFLTYLSIIIIIILINSFYVKLFIPIFNKLSPLEDGELKQKIIAFADKVGYEITKISIIDSSKRSTKLNAFFSGFGKNKQVVLYDTLIQKMNDEQIISVLAHEIGHAKYKHVIKNLIISLITMSIYLLILLFSVKSHTLSLSFGFKDTNFGFGLVIFIVLISPIVIIIEAFTSYISRKFEYEADYYAAVNGYKQVIIESLKILARENYANLTPHPLYVSLRYTHPPISLRINALKQIKS